MATPAKVRNESPYVFAPYEYVVRWEPVQSIRIPECQHPAYPNAVKQLKADFDPRSYGFITLSQRVDDSLWVLDGQTRLKVHEELGIPSIKAEIRTDLTEAQEAQLYLFLSRNASRGPADQFTARVIAQDSIALTIQTVITQFGLTMGRFGQKPVANQQPICCTKKLDQIVRSDPTGERLESTLSLIFDTWEYSPMAVGTLLVDTIATFLERHDGKFKPASFKLKLSEQTIPKLRTDALTLQQAKPRMSLKAAMLERMVEAYNHGLPQVQRLEL